MTDYDTLIIGAGISGLLAARELRAAGQRVLVLDKGRGVGGRMATRRLEEGVFDHGAQFFTVRDERFKALVATWLTEGLVVEWTRGFADSRGVWQRDGHPRFRGAQGMTTVPKFLAQGLKVHTGQRVISASMNDDQWCIQTEQGGTLTSQNLLLTPPVPQSLELLDAGGYSLPDADRAVLEGITYHPCIAVMVLLDAPANVPEPGGMQLNGEPISWIADNYRKGISPAYGLTIHGAPGFSREHFEGDRDAAGKLLLEAAAPYMGEARVRTYQVHGWRYSQPVTAYPASYLAVSSTPPLVFAGDAFAVPRVEGAALSGLAAADYLRGLSS